MKLFKEQYDELKARLDYLKTKYQSIKEEKSDSYFVGVCSSDGVSDISTSYSPRDVQKLINQIDELEAVLSTCVVIGKSESEVIEVGSEFTASIDYDGETESDKYLLCDEVIAMKGVNVVSTKSPFGKAVLGKSKDEVFSYIAPNEVVVKGVINDVHKAQGKTIVK